MSSDGDAKHVFDPMAWCDEDTFERDDNPYDPMNCKGNDNGSNAGGELYGNQEEPDIRSV